MSAGAQGRRSAAVRTFLIADIRGYTRFTGQHGDEAASRLARKFAEVAAEGVEAWDGDLVELRGDEALAVFDSARQALRCAIELQDAFVDETSLQPELPLTVGIGIDAGEAVPVDGGYRGAALNVAARLCATAGAGEIVASTALLRLAGPMPELAIEALPERELKGIDRPVGSARVSDGAAAAHQPPSPSPPSAAPILPPELEPLVPLVGRNAELAWLRWHWRRARHGHGRTLILSGPPGIGKTRLSAELATIANAAGAPVHYLPSARGADGDELLSDGDTAASLVIVDDLDAAAQPLPRAVAALGRRATEMASLVLITHRQEAAPSLLAITDPLSTPERRRALGPLDADAVRAIAAVYAGRALDELPLREVVETSHGVPAAVHRVAASWARSSGTRRLGSSANRTATGRRDLRAAEDELIADVADLELLRERTRRLEAQAADGPAGVPSLTVCPYKGLAAYEAVDAEYYFGRERLVAELVARLVGNHFLGLVGASGSGKSSALRAGLLPALAGGVLPGSERWVQVIMRPGEHPLTELMQALARGLPGVDTQPEDAEGALTGALGRLTPGQILLLAVDQFEEVFGAARDENERGAFIDLVARERPGLRVIVTIRADHYGHCAPYPALARLMGANHVLVGPLTPAELEAVIEAPAQRVGLRVEPALVQELIADAGSEPGVLPLLSTSLLELWQARVSGRLTLAAYRAGGGLKGAVARLAEAAFAELNPGQAAIARSVFLRLAGPGEGEGLVRRRVPLAELDIDRDPIVAQVVDRLTAARLLTAGDGFVEVAHEALLREWPRLQAWLEEDANGRRLRLHLIGAVRDWELRGREPADLYRGARLSAALDWASEHQVEINATERQFLEESRLASEREVARERRRNRRLRALLTGTALLLVVAIAAGAFALTQADSARDQAAIAQQREADALAARLEAESARAQSETARSEAEAARVRSDTDRREAEAARIDAEQARVEAEAAARFARSRELAASSVSVLDEDPALSKLLAISAAQLAPIDVEIESGLHQAWAADTVVDRWTWPEDKPISTLWTDLHPEGELMLASGGFDRPRDDLLVIDIASDRVLWEYTPPWQPASVGQAYFSRDGKQVIASVFWEPDEEVAAEKGQEPPPDALGVFVWETLTGRLVKRIGTGRCGSQLWAHSATVVLAQAGPEGPDAVSKCFSANFDASTLEAIDLATGSRTVLTRAASGDTALSLDGRFAAYGDNEVGSGVVVELATGKRVLRVDTDAIVQQSRFVRNLSADGSLLLWGDRPMAIVEVATGRVLSRLGVDLGESFGSEFAPEGTTLYTTGRDATVRGWDAATGRQLFVGPAGGSGRPSATVDGRILVGDFGTATATVLEAGVRGEVGKVTTCAGFVPAGTLDISGTVVVFTNNCFVDGSTGTYVVDLKTLEVVASAPDADGQSLALSPDGGRFLRQASKEDELIEPLRIYDARTGRAIVELQGMCVWDAARPGPREENGPCKAFPEPPFPLWNVELVWSPDGRYVAAVDHNEYDGYLAVWDANTGKLFVPDQDHSVRYENLIFTPDSRELVTSTDDDELVVFSTKSWKVARRATLKVGGVGFAGFLSDGTLVGLSGLGGSGGGSLHRIDMATLGVTRSTRAHDGSPKSLAVNAGGTLIVTGAADGIVRVWDGPTLALLHQFSVKGQAQGVAFADDARVAVTPQGGNLLIMSIDPPTLLETVRASVTRAFTPDECQRFGFGDACPTPQELGMTISP